LLIHVNLSRETNNGGPISQRDVRFGGRGGMGRAGLVQLVSASSPSHQVLGLKPLQSFCGGKTLLQLFPSPDSTRVGASGTGSALLGGMRVTVHITVRLGDQSTD
jgi:hypothetical protein